MELRPGLSTLTHRHHSHTVFLEFAKNCAVIRVNGGERANPSSWIYSASAGSRQHGEIRQCANEVFAKKFKVQSSVFRLFIILFLKLIMIKKLPVICTISVDNLNMDSSLNTEARMIKC